MTHSETEHNNVTHPLPEDNLGDDPLVRLKNLLLLIAAFLAKSLSSVFAIVALIFLAIVLILGLFSDLVFRN